MATFAIVQSVIAEISVNTTDVAIDGGAQHQTFVRDGFAHKVKVVSSIVGAPVKRQLGMEPSANWIPDNGSRLTDSAIEFGCSLDVTSPKFVEIQSHL